MEKNFETYAQAADLLKALAHPVRLCIVKGIIDNGSCNVTYMQECLELPQSTVSQHLQKLRSLGIVKTEKNGLKIIYSVKDERIKHLIQILLEEQT